MSSVVVPPYVQPLLTGAVMVPGIRRAIANSNGSAERVGGTVSRSESDHPEADVVQVWFRPEVERFGRWDGLTEADVVAAARLALAEAGCAHRVAEVRADVSSGPFGRCSMWLRCADGTVDTRDPPAADLISDVALFRALHQRWPHARISMPSVAVEVDLGAPSHPAWPISSHDLTTTRPLERLVQGTAETGTRVGQAITPQERAVLDAWSPGDARHSVKLRALLGSRPRLGSTEGERAIDTIRQMNLFSPFWTGAFDLFRARYGTDALARSMVLYSGHGTSSTAGMEPMLNAFGAPWTGMWLSRTSGTAGGHFAVATQRPHALIREERLHRASGPTFPGFVSHLLRNPPLSFATHHLLVDKLGAWVAAHGSGPLSRVPAGALRALLHNSDDRKALANGIPGLRVLDFDRSAPKSLEGRFIGQHNALLAQRAVRLRHGQRIGDLPVLVYGFGRLGQRVVEAMLRRGKDPALIWAIDTDANALNVARRLGLCEGMPHKPFARGAVFSAVDGEPMPTELLKAFTHDAIAVPISSDGRAFDPSLRKPTADRRVIRVPDGCTAWDPLDDLEIILPSPGGDARIFMLAEGRAANLARESWADRYDVTAAGIVGGMLQLAQDGSTDPTYDRELGEQLVALAEATGLCADRPLEARDGDDPKDLVADLNAFETRLWPT